MRTRTLRVFICAAALLFAAIGLTHAQAPTTDLEGTWQGTLVTGSTQLRLIVRLSKTSDGLYLGTLESVDQGGVKIPIDRIQVTGDSVRLELKAVNGTFDGAITRDHTSLTGTWRQGVGQLPLELTRAAAPSEPAKPAGSTSTHDSPFGVPLVLDIPVPPMPFTGDSKIHLVYELHITNFDANEVLLTSLDVMNAEVTVAHFEGSDLNSLLIRPGTRDLTDRRAIGPGLRAIGYVWLTFDASARVPQTLQHRITIGNHIVNGGRTSVSAVKAMVLGAPLRGADWIALNGPSSSSIHRRALIPLEGKAPIAQRFAIDWVQRGSDGHTFTGDQKDNKSYRAYGSEVLAVADAVVASTRDGIPENVPGITSRAVPMTPDTLGGNHVILDLSGGCFAFYAHLQPGSLRVKTGDRVHRGRVLALVGNSGNSTEPHLHFHVADANSPLAGEGLPYTLESFDLMNTAGRWETRHNELPLQNAHVRFR